MTPQTYYIIATVVTAIATGFIAFFTGVQVTLIKAQHELAKTIAAANRQSNFEHHDLIRKLIATESIVATGRTDINVFAATLRKRLDIIEEITTIAPPAK